MVLQSFALTMCCINTSQVEPYSNVFVNQIIKTVENEEDETDVVSNNSVSRCLRCKTDQLLGCGLGELTYGEQVFSAWLPLGSGADCQAGRVRLLVGSEAPAQGRTRTVMQGSQWSRSGRTRVVATACGFSREEDCL